MLDFQAAHGGQIDEAFVVLRFDSQPNTHVRNASYMLEGLGESFLGRLPS
jgi:hypothetical protein